MKTTLLNFRIPPALLAQVTEAAAAEKLTVSEWVRRALCQYLKKEKPCPCPCDEKP